MERSEIVARASQVGVVVASATVPATFARSLSDRSWVDQGVITGLSTITQYAVSVLAQDGIDIGGAVLAKVLPFPESWSAEQRRRTAILLLDMAVVPVGFGLVALFRFRDNDNQLRTSRPPAGHGKSFGRQSSGESGEFVTGKRNNQGNQAKWVDMDRSAW